MEFKEIHLKSRPKGIPVADDFDIVSVDLPEPAPGQVLLRNVWMSVDPYMRGQMRFAPEGSAIGGGAIGEVVASAHDDFKEGDFVEHHQGWREGALSDGRGLRKVDPDLAPLSAYLGVLGMPGLTAYGGLLRTGEYKDGEVVFVSAASGAVGSVVGQIARIRGGVAIGSAGSDAKVSALKDEFGFHHAFNYKTAEPLAALREASPEGIDIYFENVGGPQLEAALEAMKMWGRIPICGMISNYNDQGEPSPGPRNLTSTIYKHVCLRGFVVTEFEDMRSDFVNDVSSWIKSGELKYHETVLEGIDNAPNAFIGLFTGANDGKMLVKLA